MSSLLSAELSATCNALGTFDKKSGKYLIDEFTLNTVKDLIRYLRRDGEEHEIRRHFGQTKVLQTDLILMLIDHWEQDDLFDVTLRLLVNLTNPALLLYREEVPTERSARHNYLQILQHLQCYKEEAFTKVETWTVFAKKLTKTLEIDWSERDEDTGLIIERILILIRNVLHVPADLDTEKRPENDASVHDQVLWALNQSGILDIILYMSSENEKQYFMHIVEIITHLLREQNPTSLADAALQRSVDEKLRDEQELLTLRMTENKQRLNKIKQFSSTRHSRFGGTYVVRNMKSISDAPLVCLRPADAGAVDFASSGRKDRLLRPKNRRPAESGALERRSAFAVRLFLKEFCIEFLNSSYNPLMHYVKDVLVRAKAQQNDESYYLWACKFFMEFNRGHNFQVGLVSETMSQSMFHYVQQQMEKYYDMIKMEKKKHAPWVRRLHLALKAYKELLHSLLAMDRCGDPAVKESAKVLKSNIFYVLEYREFIVATFLNYDDNKMPRSYLVDLVETVHLFLKMLEHYCKKTGLVVQKKVRKKTKAKKRAAPRAGAPAPRAEAPRAEAPRWEAVRAQLAAVLPAQGARPPPFDAASDVPIDEQKGECMKKIQRLMREGQFEDAVGTLRAARDVWPEDGIFGGSAPEEELDVLGTVYNTDLGAEPPEEVVENHEEEEYDDEEDEEEEQTSAIVESDFDFEGFVSRFCHPRVVSACVSLLEHYDRLPPLTTHCALKTLHRVAWDCRRPAMLYQASLFRVFQRVLADRLPMYKELEKFAVFVVRKFAAAAARSPKVFVETLFWTNSRDALDVELGYESYADPRDKPGKNTWSEEQEDELRRLYMENQTNPQTNDDVIDWILDNLIDTSRTRRAVIKKLKDLGLIFRAPTKRANRPAAFTEQEDAMLTQLWEEFKDTEDPLSSLSARLPRRSKRALRERLRELGALEGVTAERGGSDSDSSVSDARSPAPAQTKKVQKRQKHSSKKPKPLQMSATEIAAVLIKAVDNDLTPALAWLAECLEEAAADRAADGAGADGADGADGAAPLVPLSAAVGAAVDGAAFGRVLRAVGAVPPSDEQESYWRIPGDIHFETLRARRELILKAISRELTIDQIAAENRDQDSSDDDDLFDNLRKMRENHEGDEPITVHKSAPKNIEEPELAGPVDTLREGVAKRKRSATVTPRGRDKMQKIVEEDETNDDEDVLSFAKRTLEQDVEPDTEEILGARQDTSGGSDNEDDVIGRKLDHKRRRILIEDDSD